MKWIGWWYEQIALKTLLCRGLVNKQKLIKIMSSQLIRKHAAIDNAARCLLQYQLTLTMTLALRLLITNLSVSPAEGVANIDSEFRLYRILYQSTELTTSQKTQYIGSLVMPTLETITTTLNKKRRRLRRKRLVTQMFNFN